jgi:hypothetical protein
MTVTTDRNILQVVEALGRFDVDTQLALLWFGYLDLKEGLNPANAPASQDIAEAFYHSIEALPHDQQLQAQRDIAGRVDNEISRSYGALSPSAKMDVWLRLAQGMEDGRIIGMPADYKLPSETDQFVAQVKQLDFENRVSFARAAAAQMGSHPQQGAPV